MRAIPNNQWYALRLASVAIARNPLALERLAQDLTTQFNDSQMASIWREARIGLLDEDNDWLEEELYRVLAPQSSSQAA